MDLVFKPTNNTITTKKRSKLFTYVQVSTSYRLNIHLNLTAQFLDLNFAQQNLLQNPNWVALVGVLNQVYIYKI